MVLRQPRPPRTTPLLPYTTLYRSPARTIACPAYAPLYGREIRSRPHRRQLLPIAQEAFERRRHARSSIPRPPRRSGDQGPASPSPWLSDKPPPDASGNCSHKASKRSEEHTSELQSLMRISYAVFCLKTKKN